MRTAPGAARLARRGLRGELLPWSAERGSILMGRPGALPPGQPGSLLPLLRPVPPKSLRARGPAVDPHSKRPEPWGTVRRPGSPDACGLDFPGEGPDPWCEAVRGRSEGLGYCRGCPAWAWARAPNRRGSWERRCCLGMGVAILGGWEMKGGT